MEDNRAAAAPTPVERETCRHEWEARHESWPCGAGMHTDSYEVCTKCGTVQDETVPAAQPVEGPREPTCETCGKEMLYRPFKDGEELRDYWIHKATFKRYCYEGVARPAAPVEGVERVTDDAPARREPDGSAAHPFIAQPAKHTDDRPAETIPERWQSVLEDINRTPTHLQNIQQTHRRVLIGELGRAETRIEVLEAALRGIADTDWRKWDEGLNSPEEFVRWAKSVSRAALAAPSGEQEKV